MFKPVLTISSIFMLGVSGYAYAAYTSGSIQPVYSSCSNAGYRASAGNYCGYSTKSIYTGTSGGACLSSSMTTCYSGGTAAYSSCPSGYRSSNSGYCGSTTTSFYKPAASCSSQITCYSGGSTCTSSCPSGYGYTSVASGKCYTGSTTHKYCSTCASRTCYAVANVCSSSSYPYSSISNATMSGACTGYRSTSGGACSGSSATYYSGYSCNSGYCGTNCGTSCTSSCPSGYGYTSYTSSQCYTGSKSHTYCSTCGSRTCYSGVQSAYSSCTAAGYKSSKTGYCGTTQVSIKGNPGGTCSTLTCYSGGYKKCSGLYTSSNIPSNATLSGTSCYGYNLATTDGSCAGTLATWYTSFTCPSGYCKVGSTCKKTYSSCKAAGYLDTCASNCTATKVTVYNSSCSTLACVSCTNCTTTGTGCSSCCTSSKPYCYNNTCWSTCPTSSTGLLCPTCAIAGDELLPIT